MIYTRTITLALQYMIFYFSENVLTIKGYATHSINAQISNKAYTMKT